MSVQVNTNTNTVNIQNAHQTITIVDNENNNAVNISQPLVNVIEVATPGPQGPAGPAGGGINISTFATTGSNTFVGSQIISGNLVPAGPYVDNTSSYNLGSPTQAWKELYVSNGSIYFLNGNTSSSISLDSNGNIALPSASLTGSLLGTASFTYSASQALTASFAPNYVLTSTTSSMLQPYVLTSVTSSMLQPYVLTNDTASMLQPYVLTSATSSMLQPYVLTSVTSSMLQPYVLTTSTSSMTVGTASLALSASGSLTGSLLGTASWASSSITASYVSGNIFTSTNPALSASYALTASYAMNGGGGPPVDTSTFVTTSSFNDFTSSINSFTSSVNSTLSNVAIISGGNSFVGAQTIEGSLSGNVEVVNEDTASVLNCSTGNFFTLDLSPNAITTISLIGLSPGQTVNLKIRMGGNNTVTLDSNIYEPVASPYTPSSGANQEDILTFISFGGGGGTRAYMSYVKNLA